MIDFLIFILVLSGVVLFLAIIFWAADHVLGRDLPEESDRPPSTPPIP